MVDREIPYSTFPAEPRWDDKPVAIIGGGPSLVGADFERLRGRCHVVAINASMFDVPWADCGVSIDMLALHAWWDRLSDVRYPVYWAIDGARLRNEPRPFPPTVQFLKRDQGDRIDMSGVWLSGGGTSGFAATVLSAIRRPRRIVLLGFDYAAGRDEKARVIWHHNDRYYNGLSSHQRGHYWERWARNFDKITTDLKRLGIEMINASPQSRVLAFRKVSVEEGFELLLDAERCVDGSKGCELAAKGVNSMVEAVK